MTPSYNRQRPALWKLGQCSCSQWDTRSESSPLLATAFRKQTLVESLPNENAGLIYRPLVQWLGYMTLTHEIRVQFPARDPCFNSLQLLQLYHLGLSVEASYDMISRFHELLFPVSRLGFMVLTTTLYYIEHCTRYGMIQDCVT